MALFGAYADANTASQSDDIAKSEDLTWLNNSSFKIDVTPFTKEELPQLHAKHLKSSSSDSESSGEPERKRKKRKHKKSKSHKKLKSSSRKKAKEKDDETFSIDNRSIPEYKYVDTIRRPSAPKYKVYKYIGLPPKARRKKFVRYFNVIIDKHVNESESDPEKMTTKDLQSDLKKEENPDTLGLQQEEEMSNRTAQFNRDLQSDPENIDLWAKYVSFQDEIFNFEKTFRKGSIAKGQRVTAERKLSILDKALQHNPDCERLLRLRLEIAVSVFPADELQKQLETLVQRDSGNIILWQGFIEATQCSMSHCTTPSVIDLYIRCLHTLHTLRRSAKVNRSQLEESILRMLYQCGLFLKQAGLFEQLWTLLRMYLELNLADGNAELFASGISIGTNEKELEELEEVVLKSQLPIHELWLRVEKLREASHWLPIPIGMDSADPQRVVFSDDVSELIHPITMPGNTFRLTVTIMTLLKIPLLPCRHTTMQEFGIDYVPWALDSVETLLPIFLPLYAVDVTNKLLLQFAQKLAVGPQYLKTLPGQEEYLQFILLVMQKCITCLSGPEKTAITIWWFRFQRLLVVLENEELFKISTTLKKKLRADMKAMLKENATNVALFKEYALVELESGKSSSAENVLKTSIALTCNRSFTSLNLQEQSALFSVVRTLVEMRIFNKQNADKQEERKDCMKHIAAIVLDRKCEDIRFVTQSLIAEVKIKFAELNIQFLNPSMQELHGMEHFLPDFITDLIILNAYFLYLSDSIGECRIFVENILTKFDSPEITATGAHSFRKEVLHEFLVAVLYKAYMDAPCRGGGLYDALEKYLHSGIEFFPNNLFLLSTLAKLQSLHSNYGQPWWKVQHLLLQTGHALSTIFLIFIANQRMCDIETNWNDTITGTVITSSGSFKNRMLNLFKLITRSTMCTRRCGLVWRLYLQFLQAHFDPKVCRDAYYIAVEECPWLKSLYIDAAIYIPEDLAQIQDLIIEKQLRIHVTPEELEVLRG